MEKVPPFLKLWIKQLENTANGLCDQIKRTNLERNFPFNDLFFSTFSHLNINPKLTGLSDPHLHVPEGLIPVGQGCNNVVSTVQVILLYGLFYLLYMLQSASNYLAAASIVIDGVRLASAIKEDFQNGSGMPVHTIETTAEIAGSVGGGVAGAVVGENVGKAIGGMFLQKKIQQTFFKKSKFKSD